MDKRGIFTIHINTCNIQFLLNNYFKKEISELLIRLGNKALFRYDLYSDDR